MQGGRTFKPVKFFSRFLYHNPAVHGVTPPFPACCCDFRFHCQEIKMKVFFLSSYFFIRRVEGREVCPMQPCMIPAEEARGRSDDERSAQIEVQNKKDASHRAARHTHNHPSCRSPLRRTHVLYSEAKQQPTLHPCGDERLGGVEGKGFGIDTHPFRISSIGHRIDPAIHSPVPPTSI